MANLNASIAFSVVENGVTTSTSASLAVTQATNAVFENNQTATTTTAAISLGGISTPGYMFVKNLDATNFVQIGLVTAVTSGNAMFKLLPGEFCFFPTRETTIYVLADTASCVIKTIVASV